LSVAGVLFGYTVGGIPVNGSVVIADAAGTTDNIDPPYIVATPTGNRKGTLTMFLPFPATMFGYSYTILNAGALANATRISVFSGGTLLGSLSYDGVPDSTGETGGFAGIQSTSPFDRVAVNFNEGPGEVLPFAVDNIRIAVNIPEPSTMLLVLSSMIGGWLCYRHGQGRMSCPSKTSP
jgi:hypothetical protein